MAWIEMGKWILVSDPAIREDSWRDGIMAKSFTVSAKAFEADEKNRYPRHTETVYTVCRISVPIPSVNAFLDLPEIDIEHRELWEERILREKILSLMLTEGERQEGFIKEAFPRLVAKIRGENKYLKLAEGISLKGDLWHDKCRGEEIKIFGHIFSPDGERDEVVFSFKVHGGTPSLGIFQEPKVEEIGGRHLLWCQKLSNLVVVYIRDLARYMSSHAIRSELNRLADEIESSEPWGKLVARISRNLFAIPVDLQDSLIQDLRMLGKKHGINLV